MLLVGDLGGTKTLLASVKPESDNQIEFIKSYNSGSYDDFGQILEDYLNCSSYKNKIKSMSLAVAGPVINNNSELTNLKWMINSNDLSQKTNISQVKVYNDLEAIAAAICSIEPFTNNLNLSLLALNNPQCQVESHYATKAIVAPGTGLGVAYAINHQNNYICMPSQGGHISFAPVTDLQQELLNFMQAKYNSKQIGLELVCSGIGIANIFDFICNYKKVALDTNIKLILQEAKDKVPIIIDNALENRCAASIETINLFIELLATAVQTVALISYAQGGIYLAGGIAVALRQLLVKPNFINLVINNKTMAEVLALMPIYLCQNKHIALIGASKLLNNPQIL